jgi:hypothetical protein
MNKLKLITLVLLSAVIVQSCKKDTVTATAYTTDAFQANINGATLAPDSIGSAITYNSAAKTKVFNLSGEKNQKQIIMSVTLKNAGNTPGFTLGTFNVDSAATTTIQFNTIQKNASGNYVYLPHGAVSPGSGTIVVTAVDSVKKQITGTFNFYSRSTDSSGAVTVDNILGGEFTALPYTFTSN